MQIDRETEQGRCACTFSQRVLGDGCRYCQPQEYIDRLHVILEEERSEAAAPVELPEPDGFLEAHPFGLLFHQRKPTQADLLTGPCPPIYTADTVRRLLEHKP